MTIQTRPGRFRHTVILTATEKGLERFESLDAMPPVLRAQCLRALESRESGTVVIAGESKADASHPQADPVELPAQVQAANAGPGRSRQAWAALGLLLPVLAAAAFLLLGRG
ncbi:MAG: hypothetical protein ACOYX1_08515 [Acidobacteriota bacterium]